MLAPLQLQTDRDQFAPRCRGVLVFTSYRFSFQERDRKGVDSRKNADFLSLVNRLSTDNDSCIMRRVSISVNFKNMIKKKKALVNLRLAFL